MKIYPIMRNSVNPNGIKKEISKQESQTFGQQKTMSLKDLQVNYGEHLVIAAIDKNKISPKKEIIFIADNEAPIVLNKKLKEETLYKPSASKYHVEKTRVGNTTTFEVKLNTTEKVKDKNAPETFATIKLNHSSKTKGIEVAISNEKPGLTSFVRYPNGLSVVIPESGYYKHDGLVEVDMRKKTAKSSSPSFKGNLIVSTGFEPQKAIEAVKESFTPQYMNSVISPNDAKKVKARLEKIENNDADVLILTAGFGSRIKPLTRETGDIKPTLPTPAANSRFVTNAMENAMRATIINKHSKLNILHEPEISGSASHFALAKRNNLIGEKPVLVLSSDHIHDIDFSKVLEFYDEKMKSDNKPFAVILAHPVTRREISNLGAIRAEDSIIKGFVEKPKEPEKQDLALIPGEKDKFSANTGIYVFSPDAAKLLSDLEPKLRGNDGIYDFGKNVFSFLSKLFDEGYATLNDGSRITIKEINEKYGIDLQNQNLYVYNNPEGTYWNDGGADINECLKTFVDVAKNKDITLPKHVRKAYNENVDVENKVVTLGNAATLKSSMINFYDSEITANNVMFVKRG